MVSDGLFVPVSRWAPLRALYVLTLVVDGATHTTLLRVKIKKLTAYRERQKQS